MKNTTPASPGVNGGHGSLDASCAFLPIPRGVARSMRMVCLLVGLTLIGTWMVTAIVHCRDGRSIAMGDGVWMAYAYWFNHGVLYPAFYDGEHYSGTRWMATPILAHAGLARLTGDYVMSGKLLNALWMAFFLGALIVALRRVKCPIDLAILLSSSLLLTDAGWLAGLSIRNDALPAGLQLTALTLAAARVSRNVLITCGVLCAVAFSAKFSAVWAGAAIGVSLLIHDRRGLVVFLASEAVALAILLGLFWYLSEGKIVANVLGLGFMGYQGRDATALLKVARGFLRSIDMLLETSPLGASFVPFVLFGLIRSAAARRFNLYQGALAVCAGVTCVQFGSPGIAQNHLIDLLGLFALLTGQLWSQNAPAAEQSHNVRTGARVELISFVQVLILVTVLWTVGTTAYYRKVHKELVSSLSQLRSGRIETDDDYATLRRYLGGSAKVLSEDPFIPILFGQAPVVTDPFWLPHHDHSHPEWIDALIRRIRDGEFDHLVLYDDLESPRIPGRYSIWHFGNRITNELKKAYVKDRKVGRYTVYRLRRQ